MSQDFFQALFEISHARLGVRCWEAFQFLLACGLCNAFPIPQKLAGTRRALQYAAELVDDGYSLLFFPEGTRSLDGSVLPFQSGISLIASKLRVAVVPVRIDGLFSLFPAGATWPKSGPVSVAFGAPVAKRDDESFGKAASRVREALLQLPVLGD
jgi:long-chain acyl-CoA synthetase